MYVICVNELEGPTGYHKAVVELANGLHRGGNEVVVLAFQGSGDGGGRMMSTWPIDADISTMSLRSLAPENGRHLYKNYHVTYSTQLLNSRSHFTENQLLALRRLNELLTSQDTIVFTSSLTAAVTHQALKDVKRNPRTVLQIHGDYQHHKELWDQMAEARPVIDRLQTVSSGLRDQFLSMFDAQDVTFVPNFPGESAEVVKKEHQYFNVVFPGSFQPRKNQKDAIKALARVQNTDVHLTLWGDARTAYAGQCRQLAAQLGVADRVHFPGFGTAEDVYSEADVVIMTSVSEGLGYPLIEGAINGLPVVAFDFEYGPRDIIEHEKSGFIVPMGDVDVLAGHIDQLAGDEELCQKMGAKGRQVYEQKLAAQPVLEQYEAVLGNPGHRSGVNLVDEFSADGNDPVDPGSIFADTLGMGRFRKVTVKVATRLQLDDVLVDNGKVSKQVPVKRTKGHVVIPVDLPGTSVISYTLPGDSDNRYYLTTVLANGKNVTLPYLRRDAGYDSTDQGTLGLIIPASIPLISHVSVTSASKGMKHLVGKLLADVMWKVKQVKAQKFGSKASTPGYASASSKESAPVEPATPQASDIPHDGKEASPSVQQTSPQLSPVITVGKSSDSSPVATNIFSKYLRALRSLTKSYAAVARQAMTPLLSTSAADARREISRHPRFPVVTGIDNFGQQINTAGGVKVVNTGVSAQPTVTISGEYDWVDVTDAQSTRRISSPVSYRELFDAICSAERDYGLFDMTTHQGIHPWELGRQYLVGELARALGLWGLPSGQALRPNKDVYEGPKKLTTAPHAQRVLYDFHRRGQTDYRISAFRDDKTMVITQPDPDGYSEVTDTNMLWPVREYNQWVSSTTRRLVAAKVPDVDSRPYEEALSKTLGIKVKLDTHLRRFLLTFIHERDFWTPVFEHIKPEEVILASPLRFGIAVAGQRAGAVASEVQYALTSKYHGTFWYGGTPHHAATRFYTWSPYWAQRTNIYQDHVVVPRADMVQAIRQEASSPANQRWDVCVIAQQTVFRRMMDFVARLSLERPELRIVIAPHPGAPRAVEKALSLAGLQDKVDISPLDTLTTITQSGMALGSYSTSVWEAAALGKPTFVLPYPGYELALDDIESGLVKLAEHPADLEPCVVPAVRQQLFGE